MPGTIHVTVVEFKGISSSTKPSAKFLRVSMGKSQYQTWDKGNFSFPITKIRENLVVALLEAGGNEIAHQDIKTMLIIEKGSWDEVFSINGAGHVHLKLQFTLSEEERNRVRVMRESAMKKKLELDPNIKLRFQEAVTSTSDSLATSMNDEQHVPASTKGFDNINLTRPKVEASQAGSSPASSAVDQMERRLILDTALPVEKSVFPIQLKSSCGRNFIIWPKTIRSCMFQNATDGSQSAPSSPVRHEIEVEYPKTETPQLASIRSGNRPQKQGPNPSSVRKMISAFENSQLQEVKTMKRAASVPSQLNKLRKEDKTGLVRQLPNTVSRTRGEVLNDCEPSQDEKELASTAGPTLSERTDLKAEGMPSKEIVKEGEKSTIDLMRQSASETATTSGRTTDEQSLIPQPYTLSLIAEGRGRGTGLKSSTTMNVPKTLEHYKEEYHSAQSSGMWIFPDNTRRLCITTAGEQVMKIVGCRRSEAKTHQANRSSSEMHKHPMHEKDHEIEKKSEKLGHQPDSVSGSSPNDSSSGLIRRVIKIAVIIGFGVVVLLTRQKEPRRKHKEEKDDLFHIPDYVDERTLKPWTGKQ